MNKKDNKKRIITDFYKYINQERWSLLETEIKDIIDLSEFHKAITNDNLNKKSETRLLQRVLQKLPMSHLYSLSIHYKVSFKDIVSFFKILRKESKTTLHVLIDRSQNRKKSPFTPTEKITEPFKIAFDMKAAPHEIAELMSLYDVSPKNNLYKRSPADLIKKVEGKILVKRLSRLAIISLQKDPSMDEGQRLITTIKQDEIPGEWSLIANVLIRFAKSKTKGSNQEFTPISSARGNPLRKASPLTLHARVEKRELVWN
jgi:hypothetical protein